MDDSKFTNILFGAYVAMIFVVAVYLDFHLAGL